MRMGMFKEFNMSRHIHSLTISDLSGFARSLRNGLAKAETLPSHLEMLNLLTKSAGFRNYQHFKMKSESDAGVVRDAAEVEVAPAPDLTLVNRVARHFDAEGVLLRWPAKGGLQPLCLWALWSRMEAGRVYSDPEMTELMNRWASFGDHALLRRALVSLGYATRSKDGRIYRRIEQKPPAELSVLLRKVRQTESVA